MSIRYARNQAEKLVAELEPGLVPVNVNSIAKRLGMVVFQEKLEEGISGLLITKTGMKPSICLQANDHPHRQRFTTAHEIGHFVLRHQFQKGEHVHIDRGHFISQRGPRASQGDNLQEIEANQFAASLLMPSDLIIQAVSALKKNEDLLTDTNVWALSKTFQVSEQAITIRLETLGLL